MFQPPPAPFLDLFPAYLQFPLEEDRLAVQLRENPYAQQSQPGFSSYHTFTSGSAPPLAGAPPWPPSPGPLGPAGGPLLDSAEACPEPERGPGPVPGPGQGLTAPGHSPGPPADAAAAAPAPGPGPGLGPGSGPGPGPAGVPVGAANAPLLTTAVFPLHGAIPYPYQQPPATPNLFDHNHNLRLPNNLHPTSRRHLPPRSRRAAPDDEMDPGQSLQDDLAAQEAAARTWQPGLEGPRVGDKTPIAAITAEYAKADPVYVAKTMALPQTYSHYRPVKGDGNCGWRAIGFCYFELLIRQGSRELVQGEQLRLSQLNDFLVNSGGYDPDMFMDFVEETFQLFKNILENMQSPDTALSILASTFNEDASMGLLYHLRLLAASWLKGNRDQYEAWCETGIEGYCLSMIEPPEREIEELGIVLLVEVLLKPVGFILEIAYLDRSAGTEVNTHRFPESSNTIGPVMHLLYRPGHYDILYKPDSAEVQVNHVSFQPTTFDPVPAFHAAYDFSPLALVPDGGALDRISPMGQLAVSLDYAPSPETAWLPDQSTDPSPTPQVQAVPDTCTYSPPPQTSTQSQPTPPGPAAPATPTHSIRFSRYQYEEPMDVNAWPEQTFQTNTFKNSHFNKAHYNNPDFTPEEYMPDAADELERMEKSSKKRNHGKGSHHPPDDSMEKRGK